MYSFSLSVYSFVFEFLKEIDELSFGMYFIRGGVVFIVGVIVDICMYILVVFFNDERV